MAIHKILFLFVILFSTNLFSQNKKIDNFFLKIQEKKIKRLKEKLSSLDVKNRDKIISIISKYDKKAFKVRETMIKKRNNKLNCTRKLDKIENQLKIRKKIINLQLKKIKELKKLGLSCEIIGKVIFFERRFMRKLRRKVMKYHHGN